jgi:hypothetical protein
MSTIVRLPVEGFSPSVNWIAHRYGCNQQAATHIVWDVAFKVGTDRHYWVDDRHVARYLAEHRPIA